MHILYLIISLVSALFLIPPERSGPLKRFLPKSKVTLRRVQLLSIAALTMSMLGFKLLPVAAMVLLVGGSMVLMASWRDKMLHNDDLGNLGEEPDPNAKPAAAPSSSMGKKEAREVLGVEANANKEEIEKSYRKLMGQIHPDKGGTTYLATKINEARDVLLAGEK